MKEGVKQVIIIRKDLGMRAGKMCAQAAHASMEAYNLAFQFPKHFNVVKILVQWQATGKTKICCRVESEEELLNIYNQAKSSDLPCSLIRDAGRTEFKEPTLTAVAIGPYHSKEIDKITGKLKLL